MAAPAKAALVEWTLKNGVFADGGVAVGSFTWDSELNAVLDWDFATSGGNTGTFAPQVYDDSSSGSGMLIISDALLFFQEQGPGLPRRDLRLYVGAVDLLDTPVAQLFLVDSVWAVNGLDEDFNYLPSRRPVASGTAWLSALAPVPLPAGLPLLAGALGLLAVLRRRR